MSLDFGPQYHPPELIFWNLLGSKAQVSQSAAGVNCVPLGAPTYEAGYTGMGNAVRIDANAEAIQAPQYNQQFMQNAGCVEMWVYNDGWTYTNGVPSANLHTMWSGYSAGGGANYWNMLFAGAGIYWQVARNGVVSGGLGPVGAVGMTALNQTWHHFGFVWNTLGIGGGANTCRVYFDGVSLVSTNAALVMPVIPNANYFNIGLYRSTANFFWLGRLDNVKHWNYDKTDFSDRFTEGFTPPAPAPGARPPELIVPKWASLEIGGYAVTDRMSDLPKFREEVSSSADGVFAGTAEIDARNFDASFSLGNPTSFFAGTNWQGKQVLLYDRWGDLAWDGLLEAVEVNEAKRETKIVSRSRLYRWRDERVVYTSAAPETPAGALYNIFAAVGFTDYDGGTLQASIDAQTADALSIFVTLVDADNATLAQVTTTLAQYGVADVWEHLGKLYYRYADLSAARSVGTLDADDILGALSVKRGTRELVNDYAIWDSAATQTDAANGNLGEASRLKNGTKMLKNISATASTQYAIQDTATAVGIGERWIAWTNVNPSSDPRPRIVIDFDVRSDLRSVIAIGTDFALTYPREGWTAKTFRTIAIERDDEKRRLGITAVEW